MKNDKLLIYCLSVIIIDIVFLSFIGYGFIKYELNNTPVTKFGAQIFYVDENPIWWNWVINNIPVDCDFSLNDVDKFSTLSENHLVYDCGNKQLIIRHDGWGQYVVEKVIPIVHHEILTPKPLNKKEARP